MPPLQSSEFQRFDALKLREVAALLTMERMRSAVGPGWLGTFFETAQTPDKISPSASARGAVCYARALTFDPDGTRDPFEYDEVSTTLDGRGGVYRRGWHHWQLFWQIPGPDGYSHDIKREVLRACDEMQSASWGYLTGGQGPSYNDRPGVVSVTIPDANLPWMMVTHVRILFVSGAEA